MRFPAVTVLLMLLAIGCREQESAEERAAKARQPQASPSPAEIRRQAHVTALKRLRPLARRALELADPVAAGHIGATAMEPVPIAASRRVELETAQKRAWTQAKEIDADALSLTASTALRAMRFALERIDDRLHHHDPANTDLGWTVGETRRYVEDLQWALAQDACPDCAPGLELLAKDLTAAGKRLDASSPSSLKAAVRDLRALAETLERLPDRALRPSAQLTSASQTAASAARKLATRARHWSRTLPKAPDADWAAPPPRPRDQPLRRLPDRIDPKTFRRRLRIEEAVNTTPASLFRALTAVLDRLHAMQAALDGSGASAGARPVSVERCTALASRLSAVRERHRRLPAEGPDCPALIRWLGAEPRSDPQLVLAMVRHGLVRSLQRRRQSDEAATVALVTGRIAPTSQAHAMTLAILAAAEQDAAMALALRQAREAACLAAAAVWVHGGLGSDRRLQSHLRAVCEGPPAHWITAAEARPRRALTGLGLMLVGGGPAQVMALERYWWAPLGLVTELADPSATTAGQTDPGVRLQLQPLSGATGARAP